MMKIVGIVNGFLKEYFSHIKQIQSFTEISFKNGYEIEYLVFCGDNEDEELDFMNRLGLAHRVIKSRTGYLPEEFIDMVINEIEKDIPEILLFPGTDTGGELAVRLGCRLEGSSITGAESAEKVQEGLIIEKPVYSNNLTGEFLMEEAPFCISINKAFSVANDFSFDDVSIAEHSKLEEPDTGEYEWIENAKTSEIIKKSDLSNSRKILVFGKGVGSREMLDRFSKIAKKRGFETGVSRPVAMNAWTGMEKLVGVSGVICKPKVCIAAGVSGAAAFAAGIDKSSFILAINKDEDAAIFKNSDIGIANDYEEILEELFKLIDIQED